MRPEDEKPQIAVLSDKVSLAPLHACNVVFECCVLFLCAGNTRDELGEFFCGNAFAFGSAGLVSLVTLLSNESDSSNIALHSVAWYHFLQLMLHVKRLVSENSTVHIVSKDWITLVTLGNCALFLTAQGLLLKKRLVAPEMFLGIVFAGIFFATYGSGFEGHWLRSVLKALPVLVMSLRVLASSRAHKSARLVALGLGLCSVADFALDVDFLAGLAIFFLGHLIYLAAFMTINKSSGLMRGLPVFAYGFSLYSLLFPHLGSFRIPVGLYVITIACMLWRASMVGLGTRAGLNIAFGALAFGLSDSLIALNKFIDPIEHVQYPILGAYWLGQCLIAKGAILIAEADVSSTDHCQIPVNVPSDKKSNLDLKKDT